jgi:Uncharacterized protein conserved in bacteria
MRRTGTTQYLLLLILIVKIDNIYAFGGNFHTFNNMRYLRRGSEDWTWFMIGGYAILGFFLVLIVRYCIRMYSVHKKEGQTTQILEQICETDSFWNVENMKSLASDLFYKMQIAWEKKELERIKSELTPELTVQLQMILNEMKSRKEINMLNHVRIEEVKIIGCEDYTDNNKDRFTAYIYGTIQDYTIDEETEEVIQNVRKRYTEVEDFYHFVRVNDKWQLEDITNQVGLREILKSPIYSEN